MMIKTQTKIKIDTTSLAECFGCHMSFLDRDERRVDLIECGVCNAEIVHVLRRSFASKTQ